MADHTFVVCVDSSGYEASLEVRKLCEVLADADAADHDQVRIIDESGEDYLYPRRYFADIELPDRVAEQIHRAA